MKHRKINGKKFISLLLSVIMLISIIPMAAQAASYSSDWRYWSQAASDVWGMRSYGCWVVAQAKLLYEANIDRSGSFNPDSYYWWQVNNGYIDSNYYQTNGANAPVAYANQKGKSLQYLGYWDASDSQLWYNINAGYYTIVKVNNGGHYVYIANDLSKQNGQIYCYDSWTDYTPSKPRLLSYYGVHNGGYVYKANGSKFTSVWSDNITSTNATVHATMPTTYVQNVGCYIDKQTSYMGTRLIDNTYAQTKDMWFNMNEYGVTLSPGTTYYYKFFVIIDGVEYQSEVKSFTTSGSHSHSYTSKITTEPTCTKTGVKTYTCSCGASYTETIAKTSHNSNTSIPAVAATCTTTGLTAGKKCSMCGTVTVAQQTVPAKSHTDSNADGYCDSCGTDVNPQAHCSCSCHKTGFAKLLFTIINFFQKLFGNNTVCDCGAKH